VAPEARIETHRREGPGAILPALRHGRAFLAGAHDVSGMVARRRRNAVVLASARKILNDRRCA